MDTLPLPPRPDLAHYRKRAKDLVTASRSADSGAVRAWAARWLNALARLLGYKITPFVQSSLDRAIGSIEEQVRLTIAERAVHDGFTLADAQFFIATAHGFAGWSDFADHVVSLGEARTGAFEAAVDAVVSGDLEAVATLVRRNPELIRARSSRVHRATLLHYVAANGVEDFRQKTPPNAVAIATSLLGEGAEVDALANTYGGGTDQTTMNLLVSSTHPADAGVQSDLVETLLDFGAAINGLEDNESPLMTALAFGYLGAAETLARRAARIDTIISAAALGRSQLVAEFLVDGRTLRPDVPLPAPRWLGVSANARAHIELGFVWACKFGRVEVVEIMLEKGVDPAAKDVDDMTALHWASAGGHPDVVRRLLQRGAQLEATNTWGGTVLDSTVYFARHEQRGDVDYTAVIDLLMAAGADVGAVTPFPTGDAVIDNLLRRR